MKAKIYKPSKTSMQSGLGKTKKWVFEYQKQKDLIREPLMGWTGSRDTNEQVKLLFEDIDQAINDLLSKVDKKLNTSFEELVSEVDSSEKAVAVFLALLEAIRWGFVKAEQLNNNELIKIEKNYEQ